MILIFIVYEMLKSNYGNMNIPKLEPYPIWMFLQTFEEKLTYYMWRNNIKVKILSKELGVTKTAIQFWMDGSRIPRGVNRINLCKALNVEYDDLFDMNTKRRKLRLKFIPNLKKPASINYL